MNTGALHGDVDTLGWRFDNSYARLPEYFYARVRPEPVAEANLVLLNHRLAEELGLRLSSLSDKALAEVFAGSLLPSIADPIAQAYAGHQFGHFTMLGDGRALLLGEQITPTGARYDLQFKGSGRTPFSRRGDGRAALGPMLREYLISEAMHALGIPTTRSLAVATTGDWVYRDPPQPGAVLTRVASSHLRVGTFQYAAGYQRHQDASNAAGLAAGSVGSLETDQAPGARDGRSAVSTLLRYAMARHYPDRERSDCPALQFLHAVIDRQISLLVHWMRVGFVHGVMNTDNMTISGETIDYGPCAFMDTYHPETVFSSIDHAGRYAFVNQPAIAQWNLARLAEALLTEIDPDRNKAVEIAGEALEAFSGRYEDAFFCMMAAKIGIAEPSAINGEDKTLITDLLLWMQQAQADYTYTFWRLGQPDFSCADIATADHAPDHLHELAFPWQDLVSPDHDHKFGEPVFAQWKRRWQRRLGSNAASRRAAQRKMAEVNPVVIPRNALVEEALAAAVEADFVPMQRLLAQLAFPYSMQEKTSGLVSPRMTPAGYRTFCGT
ncbi:MAG: protein adenylyltransferase SelO [Burkholderiaceae bacterium]